NIADVLVVRLRPLRSSSDHIRALKCRQSRDYACKGQAIAHLRTALNVVRVTPARILMKTMQSFFLALLFCAALSLTLHVGPKPIVFKHAHEVSGIYVHRSCIAPNDERV